MNVSYLLIDVRTLRLRHEIQFHVRNIVNWITYCIASFFKEALDFIITGLLHPFLALKPDKKEKLDRSPQQEQPAILVAADHCCRIPSLLHLPQWRKT